MILARLQEFWWALQELLSRLLLAWLQDFRWWDQMSIKLQSVPDTQRFFSFWLNIILHSASIFAWGWIQVFNADWWAVLSLLWVFTPVLLNVPVWRNLLIERPWLMLWCFLLTFMFSIYFVLSSAKWGCKQRPVCHQMVRNIWNSGRSSGLVLGYFLRGDETWEATGSGLFGDYFQLLGGG